MPLLQTLADATRTLTIPLVAATLAWAGVAAEAGAVPGADGGCLIGGEAVIERTLRPIEDIAAGDLVWARCEFTGAEGWKPVVDTIVTRPVELWTLEFELTGDGSGAPHPAANSANGPTETITGTAVHPFFVVEADDWVAMAELEPGDLLLLAEGRGLARVLGLRQSRAPPGERFTTYNVEVADLHTYFVGEAGVWVHNSGAGCDLIKSAFFRIAGSSGHTGAVLRQKRFELLEQTKTSFLRSPHRGTLTAANWAESVTHVSRRMINDLAVTGGATGNGVQLQHLPTVTEYRRFLARQPAAGHGRGASRIDIHHCVEEYVQEMLGLGKTADLPGFPMLRSAGGADGHAALAGKLRSAIKAGNTDGLSHADIIERLHDVYKSNPEWVDCWKVAREWLLHKQGQNFLQGVPIPPL